LVNSIGRLVERVNSVGEEVERLIVGLVRRGMRKGGGGGDGDGGGGGVV
jgi:elongator complex protein 1